MNHGYKPFSHAQNEKRRAKRLKDAGANTSEIAGWLNLIIQIPERNGPSGYEKLAFIIYQYLVETGQIERTRTFPQNETAILSQFDIGSFDRFGNGRLDCKIEVTHFEGGFQIIQPYNITIFFNPQYQSDYLQDRETNHPGNPAYGRWQV